MAWVSALWHLSNLYLLLKIVLGFFAHMTFNFIKLWGGGVFYHLQACNFLYFFLRTTDLVALVN